MKFYNSVGPNPRMVRMFMAEKGFEVPRVEIDLRGGENRRPPYNSAVNPAGQTPALDQQPGLELDGGADIDPVQQVAGVLRQAAPLREVAHVDVDAVGQGGQNGVSAQREGFVEGPAQGSEAPAQRAERVRRVGEDLRRQLPPVERPA